MIRDQNVRWNVPLVSTRALPVAGSLGGSVPENVPRTSPLPGLPVIERITIAPLPPALYASHTPTGSL